MNEPINITVEWREFGWVAKLHTGEESPHSPGPRYAAEQVCDRTFGVGKYRLKFKAKGWYQAEVKS